MIHLFDNLLSPGLPNMGRDRGGTPPPIRPLAPPENPESHPSSHWSPSMSKYVRLALRAFPYLWLRLFTNNTHSSYRVIEIKFELHTLARIQSVSWERCTFFNEILTF